VGDQIVNLQYFQLTEIRSNPFRDLRRNPLNQEKVDELKESIHDTGFWNNVNARIGNDGKPEIAYGHHRIEAAQQEGMTEVGLIIRVLSDSEMLKIMARENSETYKYSVLALLESVRGAVVALADGRVKPEEMPVGADTRKDLLRYAPSFVAGLPGAQSAPRPYTALSVAIPTHGCITYPTAARCSVACQTYCEVAGKVQFRAVFLPRGLRYVRMLN
jgi:hypothetical protein